MYRCLYPSLLLSAIALAACGSAAPSAINFSSPSPSGWPSTDNRLTGIACPDPSDCVAVGYLAPGYNAVGVHNRTLIEENRGGYWHVVVSPNVDGAAGSALYGVTCISAVDCIAVGESQDVSAESTTLIEEDTGSGWALVPGTGSRGALASVACAGPSYCVAVGTNESDGRTLIEDNRGKGWQVVESPDASSDDRLTAVACPSRSFCAAVGGSSKSLEHSVPLVEQNSGSGWTVVPMSGEGTLRGVACLSPVMCVATGSETYVDIYPQIVVRNLIEELTNGRWASITPPAGGIGTLGAVSCTERSYCISVDTLGSSPPGVIERINGGWSVGAGGYVTNAVETLDDVTCPTPGRCIAVGDQWLGGPADYIRPRATFIAEHSSLGWTVQASPNL